MRVKEVDRTKGFYLKVSESVHKSFKIRCIEKGENMTEVLENFMIKYAKK